MKVELQLGIGSVCGERGYTLVSPSPDEALEFLKAHDHEGASVSIVVKSYDNDAYPLLKTLSKLLTVMNKRLS